MSFSDILAKYRIVSFSERDKGERFERLMQAFLKTAPLYAGIFEHVWMWADYQQHRQTFLALRRVQS